MYDLSIMYSHLIIVVSILFLLVFSPSKVLADSPVVLNEVLVHPSAGGKEWVEFYVKDSSNLKNYWIDDDSDFASETGSPKRKLDIIQQGNDSQHYFIELSGSMFNNTEDMVVLFNESGIVVDQIQYNDGPGYDVTFGRTPDGTGGLYILGSATRGSPNTGPRPTVTPTPEPTTKPTKAPTATREPEEIVPTSRSTASRVSPTARVTPRLSPTPPKNTNSPKITTNSAKVASQGAYPTAVLGAQVTGGPTRIPLPSLPVKVQGASNAPALFTILGAGFIIASAVVVFIKKLRQAHKT